VEVAWGWDLVRVVWFGVGIWEIGDETLVGGGGVEVWHGEEEGEGWGGGGGEELEGVGDVQGVVAEGGACD
jgi:hypothetical protein